VIRALRFSAAALVLVVATLSIWHWRFVAVPDALPELKLASPLVGWHVEPYCKYEVVEENGKLLLRLERSDLSEKLPSIYVWLGDQGGLEGVAAIHFHCSARWKNVEVGPVDYMNARIVTMMRDAAGKTMHPPDFGVTGGLGSMDWHTSDMVFKVTDDMDDFGIEISMLGSRGILEVTDLSVVAVRNRSWVPVATVAVLAGWVLFVSMLIRCHSDAPSLWRTLATGVAVVFVSWFFVFPQTKGLLHPVIGDFAVGEVDGTPPLPPAPEPPLPVPALPAPVPIIPEIVEQPAPPESPDAVKVPVAKPVPEARSSSTLHKALRAVDKRLPVAHVGLFIGITLMVLFLTGRGNQWRIPLALAVLSELVPELTDHIGGWDDWADVLQNFAGVGLAVLVWKRLPVLRRLSAYLDHKKGRTP